MLISYLRIILTVFVCYLSVCVSACVHGQPEINLAVFYCLVYTYVSTSGSYCMVCLHLVTVFYILLMLFRSGLLVGDYHKKGCQGALVKVSGLFYMYYFYMCMCFDFRMVTHVSG